MNDAMDRVNLLIKRTQHEALRGLARGKETMSWHVRKAIEDYFYKKALHTQKNSDYTPVESEEVLEK